ncbi:helix-turn-helix domain-containing protein [Nocardia gipuzkoensis]|uniref:helix-turn-helix domain-containing protein n=1 Tax=Nocardia gipuzkoensis TaxID=2749991 RepID=UPI00237EA660|nr:helix-turn-helix domain-containing protein [Nocardia gipuzkoensis]MDE1671483.1 helix-turn-helix domain-containing protein [Nocardia gipuzkoensis]
MTALLRPPVVTDDLIEVSEPAPESLRPWLAEFGRIPTVLDLSEPFAHFPQTATTIVLRAEHGDLGGRRDARRDSGDTRVALVVGPQTKASYSRASKPAGCVRLRLAPGATPALLGVSAADLTDRVLRLDDLPGPVAQLATELVELEHDEVVPYLENELPRRIPDNSAQRGHRRLLATAVAAITADHPLSVAELAARLSVSERQLRNLFTSGIGVSPKHFARIDRIRRVLSQAEDMPLADIATGTGYYDQSHMTADFRSLMGVPPTSFRRGEVPAPSPCRALTRLR